VPMIFSTSPANTIVCSKLCSTSRSCSRLA
jgi:hypothetical protein